MTNDNRLFRSFWQAGFECSTHTLRGGRRLDMVSATHHDSFADRDFQRLRSVGICTVREGLRWHLIESSPGRYDFSSAVRIISAARRQGVQIVWDLLHFGWPAHVEIFSPRWTSRFAAFARAFSRVLREEGGDVPFVAPVNEISFVSWAGGDVGYLNPFEIGRGWELKRRLVQAAIAASEELLFALPQVRLVWPEPVIHLAGDPCNIQDLTDAARYESSMFEAWDMVGGYAQPELGGNPQFLDILGINYYDSNQRWNKGGTIRRDEHGYRPFRDILRELHQRYRRPMLISETGTESENRPSWLRYVAGEVRAARATGVDLQGICLYPILNHPGWDDDRHCPNGLWGYADACGERQIYTPLADELSRQMTYKDNFMHTLSNVPSGEPDIVCLSHLRWNFVFQRPQHLMSRFAKNRRVFFVEEPVYDSTGPRLQTSICNLTGVCVVTPHLGGRDNESSMLRDLLAAFAASNDITNPVLWFYTPMALEFVPQDLIPSAVVYDCMDELSMFRGAPPQLVALEKQLFGFANLVFTGGVSLFEAKRHAHPDIYAFPSGVDIGHFAQARAMSADFQEHAHIPHPRLGYAGVIDERLDLDLIAEVASQRPEWQFVMIGPTAKIPNESLPRLANIHWLGMKNYADLPNYFAGWDIGIMPFALNDATRFISPTKTPEYLAAGLPVISTAIQDVVHPYGDAGLAEIIATSVDFIGSAERLLEGMGQEWHTSADNFLRTISWDAVWHRMDELVKNATAAKTGEPEVPVESSISTPAVAEPEVAELSVLRV